MRRRVNRWSTEFGQFVSGYGVPALARDLTANGAQVTSSSIYKWLAGQTEPRPGTARAMRALSGGALSFDAIFGHREQVYGGGFGNGETLARTLARRLSRR